MLVQIKVNKLNNNTIYISSKIFLVSLVKL